MTPVAGGGVRQVVAGILGTSVLGKQFGLGNVGNEALVDTRPVNCWLGESARALAWRNNFSGILPETSHLSWDDLHLSSHLCPLPLFL